MTPDGGAPPFERVAVLGLGLMGGSLAWALSRLARPPLVTGWSPEPDEGMAALDAGAVAAVAEPTPEGFADAVAEADLVVLATPLGATCALLPKLAAILPAEVLLTDVASLKRPVLEGVRRAGLAGRWVGAHPMCGGEGSGFGAARHDLYEGANVWIVTESAPAPAIRVEGVWRSIGAHTTRTDADAHDRLMVAVSHLPQLTANVLARVLEDAGVAPDTLGPGGRDMTRLAASSPSMWRDLIEHAPDALPALLRELGAGAHGLADRIERGDLDAVEAGMAATRRWKEGR